MTEGVPLTDGWEDAQAKGKLAMAEAALETCAKLLGFEHKWREELEKALVQRDERIRDLEIERDEAREKLRKYREALQYVDLARGRCSPSACWSVVEDLKGGVSPEAEYPVQHLRRFAAEIAVLFGEQRWERLGTDLPYPRGVPELPQGIARAALLSEPEK